MSMDGCNYVCSLHVPIPVPNSDPSNVTIVGNWCRFLDKGCYYGEK